ncbi:hypothetical protein [Levilactobacillus tongjiangensis]|uniref:DUF5776 domain-containing protein n=1 Tax=Levilactobacillus tongjiangensis TaxID=2486023 RepID=A0ABW1SUL0_9LACO|nr:hypothetical protein [Levilactobacillus tongjiangensis]
MRLKKFKLFFLIGIGLSFSGVFLQTNAQAATWHKGVPSFLKHSFYRTKLEPKYHIIDGKKYKTMSRLYEGIHTYKTTIKFSGHQYSMKLSNCKYTKKGTHFIIRGKFDKNAEGYPSLKVIKHSKKKLTVSSGTLYKHPSRIYYNEADKMTKIK